MAHDSKLDCDICHAVLLLRLYHTPVPKDVDKEMEDNLFSCLEDLYNLNPVH